MTAAREKDDRWPGLMRPSTARAYLDHIGEDKWKAHVLPHLTPRMVGEREFFAKAEIDEKIIEGGIDGGQAAGKVRSTADYIERVRRDLGKRKARQSRHG